MRVFDQIRDPEIPINLRPLSLYIGYVNLCILYLNTMHCRPGSSTSKALGYGLDVPGSIPGVGEVEIFLYSFLSRLVLGSTQTPIKLLYFNSYSAVAVYMLILASTSP